MAWPSLFPTSSMPPPLPQEETLPELTRQKLERALSVPKRSLRHIVLLSNAFSASTSATSSPSASFYAEAPGPIGHLGREATAQEVKRREEQEWFDALLDGLIDQEDLEGDDGYVDVSFREPGLGDSSTTADSLVDSGWMETKDFSAHTAFQIPLPPAEDDEAGDAGLDSSAPSPTDVPELTRDHGTPESSPELSHLSLNELQLVPYTAVLKPPQARPSISIDLTHVRPTLSSDSLAHALRAVRLPIDLHLPIGWDLHDFGPLPPRVDSDGAPRRVLDDIYVNLGRRTRRAAKPPYKASVLVQSLLLS